MPDLNFEVEGAEAVTYAAAPLIAFRLRVTASDETEIHSIMLRTQIMIEPTKRHYSAEEQKQMYELFGEPERWSQTLRTMLWTHTNVGIPPFRGTTVVDLPVPCSFDFNVAATKYFHGLEEGEIPLSLLFSGSIFYADEDQQMQVTQISWEKEARYRLPVEVWKNMMEHYYPNSVWLRLRKDIFQRLYQHRISRGFTTWEQTLESILPPEAS
ncbi:DUF6084 family protein [bacterium]|nr:DUF6084 family protein [bacterium]